MATDPSTENAPRRSRIWVRVLRLIVLRVDGGRSGRFLWADCLPRDNTLSTSVVSSASNPSAEPDKLGELDGTSSIYAPLIRFTRVWVTRWRLDSSHPHRARGLPIGAFAASYADSPRGQGRSALRGRVDSAFRGMKLSFGGLLSGADPMVG